MRIVRTLVLFIASFAAAVVVSSSPVVLAQTPYRILVTNDDGVRAPGILAVAQALKALGDVTIVAPADNQSGKAHSLTVADPVYVDPVMLPNGLEAFGATATPASCVKLAVLALMKDRPNLVVSGINRGVNLGRVAYLSGTVGAAREGALLGIPAIAASVDASGGFNDYTAAAKATAEIAAIVKAQGLPRGVFLNVNVPRDVPKGMRLATQSALIGEEKWVEQKHPRGRRYFWYDYREPTTDSDAASDVSAMAAGYVAIVPLRASEYDAAAAEKLKSAIRP